MINHSQDNDFLIFNPDTVWNKSYIEEINEMQNIYFLNKMNNVLLVVNKELSYDQNLTGDFELKNRLLNKNFKKNFIFIGCQILNKNLFKEYQKKNFPISEIWSELLNKNELNGFESLNEFYHLTNLKIFKKLEDL